jgi:hypothetical protein
LDIAWKEPVRAEAMAKEPTTPAPNTRAVMTAEAKPRTNDVTVSYAENLTPRA